MVHGVREFFEGTFEGQGLPPLAAVERQSICTAAERGKTESGVGAIFVRTTDDQMTATGSHGEAARRLARIEHRLQRGNDRR